MNEDLASNLFKEGILRLATTPAAAALLARACEEMTLLLVRTNLHPLSQPIKDDPAFIALEFTLLEIRPAARAIRTLHTNPIKTVIQHMHAAVLPTPAESVKPS